MPDIPQAAVPAAADDEYTFTRDALVDALARIELRVALTGPVAGMILAESMADAIIEAMGYGAGNPVAGTREDGA